MRTVDIDGNDIDPQGLCEDYLVEVDIVKDGAAPIDNEVKFAWADDDWERVRQYCPPTPEKAAELRIDDLKRKLADTDYISAKMSDAITACDTADEILDVSSRFKERYGSLMAQRQAWRDELNDARSNG